MVIHQNFLGGNISVKGREGNHIFLENELRDTEGDWFYWAFCVENAEAGTFVFEMQRHRVGYYGPAVSTDLRTWRWLGTSEGDSFSYTFEGGETLYFAHHMLYHPSRFEEFAKERALAIGELCKSRKGRSVPFVRIGEGSLSILLTARHHACESTGDYVLEGVLSELCEHPIEDASILAIPFVDYDGVIDGDQGKSRRPHDHNRDYTDAPIYPEVASILAYAAEKGCNYAFDFHSPWHRGGENDLIFAVRNMVEKMEKNDRFAALLEAEITEGSMRYRATNDHPPCTGWNQPGPNFARTMNLRPECDLAFTLESTYFGEADNIVSAERLVALGRCFARVMKKYINERNDLS